MRLAQFFSSLAAILAVTVPSMQSAVPVPAPTPTFETLFVGTFDLGASQSLNGPYGTRIHGTLNGGKLNDASGKEVGTFLPAADTGVITASGIFFPDAVLSLIWDVDQKLATMHVVGVGEAFKSDLTYVHLETDSETYSALNGRFLIANLTFLDQNSPPVFTIYGAN